MGRLYWSRRLGSFVRPLVTVLRKSVRMWKRYVRDFEFHPAAYHRAYTRPGGTVGGRRGLVLGHEAGEGGILVGCEAGEEGLSYVQLRVIDGGLTL